MFSRGKKLKVDCVELEGEREHLSGFLRKSLNVEVVFDDHNLLVDSEKLSAQELKVLVSKFIYHQHLNNRYWAALEGGGVRIHKFEEKKSEKRKKPATTPSTIKHGWL